MEVNFDGLRKQLILNYNSLCYKLKNSEFSANSNYNSQDISNNLNNIRECLAILGCMMQDGEFSAIEDLQLEDYEHGQF
jgi:hypothetical protein